MARDIWSIQVQLLGAKPIKISDSWFEPVNLTTEFCRIILPAYSTTPNSVQCLLIDVFGDQHASKYLEFLMDVYCVRLLLTVHIY